MATIREVLEEIEGGIEIDEDLSDIDFTYSEIEVSDGDTGELDFSPGFVQGDDVSCSRGVPTTTAEACGMKFSYDYDEESWSIDDWGDVDADDWGDDEEEDEHGDAEETIIEALNDNVSVRDSYEIDDDEILDPADDAAQLTQQLTETGFVVFYDDDGTFYGRRDGMEPVDGVDFDSLTPMTASEFAAHLVEDYPFEG